MSGTFWPFYSSTVSGSSRSVTDWFGDLPPPSSPSSGAAEAAVRPGAGFAIRTQGVHDELSPVSGIPAPIPIHWPAEAWEQVSKSHPNPSHAVDLLEDRVVPALAEPLGVIAGINGGGGPPDTVMDVGTNHVIQMVNATQYQIWDKHGNALAARPASAPVDFGQPVITPDPGNLGASEPRRPDRRLRPPRRPLDAEPVRQATEPVVRGLADPRIPSGGWTASPTTATSGSSTRSTPRIGLPDYPKIGVWPDGLLRFDLREYAQRRPRHLCLRASANARRGPRPRLRANRRSTIGAPAGGYRDTRIIPADLDGVAPPGRHARVLRHAPWITTRTAGDARDRIEIYEADPELRRQHPHIHPHRGSGRGGRVAGFQHHAGEPDRSRRQCGR